MLTRVLREKGELCGGVVIAKRILRFFFVILKNDILQSYLFYLSVSILGKQSAQMKNDF